MIAQTPPMGWNSWDCWGAAVTEDTALKSKYEQIAQKHQRHYDELFANVK